MNRQFTKVFVIFLLAAGWLAAQKGQPAASPAQSGGSQQPSIPPQLYPIEQLPQTRAQAEANMTGNVLYSLKPLRGKGALLPWNRKSSPRYVWYKTTETNSYAIPVILVPMTCADIPSAWSPAATPNPERDTGFVEACRGVNSTRTPSQPTQNWNPLKLGDGLILAIYDRDGLFSKYDIRLLGMTIQSQNGSTLYPDALQPAITASNGSAPGGGSPTLQGVGGAATPGGVSDRCSADAIDTFFKSPYAPAAYTRATTVLNFNINIQARRQFYYIPWTGNPVLGDTVLGVALVAQAPSDIPLTVGLSGVTPNGPTRPHIRICNNDWQSDVITAGFPSGSRVQITAAENDYYSFVRWSDGGAWQHDVAIGSSPMNVTAEFVRRDSATVPVTVFSNPRGANITLSAVPPPAPLPPPPPCTGAAPLFQCPAGPITVSAPTSQVFSGGLQQVQSWSNGTLCGGAGATCDASLTVGQEPVTLMANYANSWQSAPSAASLTLATNTNGLLATVNGIGYVLQAVPPVALPIAVGTGVHLYSPPRQQLGAVPYSFNNWIPAVDASFPAVAGAPLYTANFMTPPVPPFAGPCTVTVATSPAGLFVGVGDGATKVFAATGGAPAANPPVNIPGPPLPVPAGGGTVTATLDASLPQYLNGVLYTFQGWSDGGAAQHPVDVYTAAAGAAAWGCVAPQPTYTATFAASASGTAIPVTMSTDPPGLWFSVNGVSNNAPAVDFFAPGSSLALNTAAAQSLGGVQYTFASWSDSSTSTTTSHSFSVPAASQQSANPTPAPPGNQSAQSPPSSASVTAVFTPVAPGPTEQPLTLLNTTFPQIHNLSRYTIASGVIYSWLQGKSWSRQETAPAVTCPAGSPQPCIPSPELYQTVQNPRGTHTIDPVLFLTVYLHRLDSERKWHPMDLVPALNLGLSLSSPSTDYFVGIGSEILCRGLQLNAGMHIGEVSELAPTVVNDPTSGAAPATIQRFQKAAYVGVTFNLNFIQTLFSAAKGGG